MHQVHLRACRWQDRAFLPATGTCGHAERRARQFIVHPAGSGYGLRIGPLVLPWLPAAVLFAVAGLAILSPVAADTWLALVGGREIVQSGLPAHDAL